MSNIKPCWWGSHVWQSMFCMVAVFPENPTKEEIENIKCFFKSLRYFLPCEGCKKSYCKFSSEPDTKIDNNNFFKTKNNLIEFVYNLRNKVNNKLTHEYHINLNYFKKKLTYMVVDEYNKIDGRICEMVEAPFIPVDLETKILLYLKNNTKYDYKYTQKLLDVSRKFMEHPEFNFNNKIFKFLYKRHKKCKDILNKINHNMSEGNYDIVQSFKYYDKHLHDKLLFYGCTMIHKDVLEKLLS